MTPATLLDTDILSALMRSTPSVLNRAQDYLAVHGKLSFSLMTRFEILRGLKAKRATKQLAAFGAFCASSQVLPIDAAVVDRAADIYADLHGRGLLIPDADILIAATALEGGFALATNNSADFGRILGLQLDNWLV